MHRTASPLNRRALGDRSLEKLRLRRPGDGLLSEFFREGTRREVRLEQEFALYNDDFERREIIFRRAPEFDQSRASLARPRVLEFIPVPL